MDTSLIIIKLEKKGSENDKNLQFVYYYMTTHAFQHELDHLEGILFTDKIDPKNPYKNKDLYREI